METFMRNKCPNDFCSYAIVVIKWL